MEEDEDNEGGDGAGEEPKYSDTVHTIFFYISLTKMILFYITKKHQLKLRGDHTQLCRLVARAPQPILCPHAERLTGGH